MTKSRSSLANSIRIVFASLFLCLFGALPAFATDGIYNQFGLDLGYAGRIGYMGGTTPEWAIYVTVPAPPARGLMLLIFPLRRMPPIFKWTVTLPWPVFT